MTAKLIFNSGGNLFLRRYSGLFTQVVNIRHMGRLNYDEWEIVSELFIFCLLFHFTGWLPNGYTVPFRFKNGNTCTEAGNLQRFA